MFICSNLVFYLKVDVDMITEVMYKSYCKQFLIGDRLKWVVLHNYKISDLICANALFVLWCIHQSVGRIQDNQNKIVLLTDEYSGC